MTTPRPFNRNPFHDRNVGPLTCRARCPWRPSWDSRPARGSSAPPAATGTPAWRGNPVPPAPRGVQNALLGLWSRNHQRSPFASSSRRVYSPLAIRACPSSTVAVRSPCQAPLPRRCDRPPPFHAARPRTRPEPKPETRGGDRQPADLARPDPANAFPATPARGRSVPNPDRGSPRTARRLRRKRPLAPPSPSSGRGWRPGHLRGAPVRAVPAVSGALCEGGRGRPAVSARPGSALPLPNGTSSSEKPPVLWPLPRSNPSWPDSTQSGPRYTFIEQL